jgi:hypothetical protein
VLLKRNKSKRAQIENDQLRMVNLKKQEEVRPDHHDHLAAEYSPAIYRKAVLFRDSMSYKKKINENVYVNNT